MSLIINRKVNIIVVVVPIVISIAPLHDFITSLVPMPFCLTNGTKHQTALKQGEKYNTYIRVLLLESLLVWCDKPERMTSDQVIQRLYPATKHTHYALLGNQPK